MCLYHKVSRDKDLQKVYSPGQQIKLPASGLCPFHPPSPKHRDLSLKSLSMYQLLALALAHLIETAYYLVPTSLKLST